MKTKILTIVIALFAVVAAYATNTLLDSFKASSDGKVIKLEWKSSDEASIARFELERASADMIFRLVKTFDAKGYASYYSYSDEEAFMKGDGSKETTQSKNIYFYHIKIVKTDNTYSFSDNVSVTHNLSSIRRTWGMIKEMFR